MIQSHDRACIERAKAAVEWRNATDAKLDSIKKSVSGIYARMWSVAGAFILILLGVIGYLIGKHGI